jgi:hypothetical protein
MSQSATASESKSTKRFQNPAYVYGPMVYQFPPEPAQSEKPKRNEGLTLLVLLLVSILITGGVIIYLREKGVDLSPAIAGLRAQPDDAVVLARVAAQTLYLREGPGTQYTATYLLPYDWPLTVLGESEIDSGGDIWVRVRLETNQGLQEGWVNQKYIQAIIV